MTDVPLCKKMGRVREEDDFVSVKELGVVDLILDAAALGVVHYG